MTPAALVFDLDGTLLDSRPDIATAANRLRRDYGLPPLAEATVGTMVGEGARVLVDRADKALYNSKQTGRNKVSLAE